MTTARTLDGLRRSADTRRTATRRTITKALREMRKKGLAINPHALAKYAGVARKSVYNHRDLLEQIRAEAAKPTPPVAAALEPTKASSPPYANNSALRNSTTRPKLLTLSPRTRGSNDRWC